MKAIRTTYRGPTDTKPAKIVACDGDGHRISLSADSIDREPGEPRHRAAAEALCEKMGWTGRLVGGWLSNGLGYSFCFDPHADQAIEALREAALVLARHAPLVKEQTMAACDLYTAIGMCRRAIEGLTGKSEDAREGVARG